MAKKVKPNYVYRFFLFGGGGHNYLKMHFFLSITQLQASKQKRMVQCSLKDLVGINFKQNKLI
jgi:hypothetical protein